MEKNPNEIDDVFNKVYLHYEDEPSGEVWNHVNLWLDKKEAEKFKKRFIGWKRLAILLLFLLSGIVIYDSRNIILNNKGTALLIQKSKSEQGTYIDKQTPASADSSSLEYGPNNLAGTKNDFYKPNSFPITKLPPLDSLATFPVKGIKQISKMDSGLFILSTNTKARDSKGQLKVPSETVEISANNTKGIHKHLEISSAINFEKALVAGKSNKQTISKFHQENLNYIDSFSSISIPTTIQKNLNTFKVNTETLHSNDNLKLPLDSRNNLLPDQFKPYWSITGFVSHEWSQYNLSNEGPDYNPGTQNIQEEISNRENHESSISGGLMASYLLTKHFGFKSGLVISNTNILIDPQEMYATREPGGTIGYKYVTSSGYAYINPKSGIQPSLGDSLQSSFAQHRIQSLAIPIQLVYRIDYRKFSIMPSAGISINFISKATVQTVLKNSYNNENISIQSLYGMRKVYLGFTGDINFQYNYSKRWSFNVLPMFRYALTPITQSNVVKTYPYSMGISAGITYLFYK